MVHPIFLLYNPWLGLMLRLDGFALSEIWSKWYDASVWASCIGIFGCICNRLEASVKASADAAKTRIGRSLEYPPGFHLIGAWVWIGDFSCPMEENYQTSVQIIFSDLNHTFKSLSKTWFESKFPNQKCSWLVQSQSQSPIIFCSSYINFRGNLLIRIFNCP